MTNLLSVSVSLFIMDIFVSGIICYVAFCDRLLLLGKMFSSFIHVSACINISFLLRMNNVRVSHSVVSNSCDPMNCHLPVSSVHGILQARILKWVAIIFFRESSPPRDQTCVSCSYGLFLVLIICMTSRLLIKYPQIGTFLCFTHD